MSDDILQQARFFTGDSADQSDRAAMDRLMQKFENALSLTEPITVILDDPAGNSYIQVIR